MWAVRLRSIALSVIYRRTCRLDDLRYACSSWMGSFTLPYTVIYTAIYTAELPRRPISHIPGRWTHLNTDIFQQDSLQPRNEKSVYLAWREKIYSIVARLRGAHLNPIEYNWINSVHNKQAQHIISTVKQLLWYQDMPWTRGGRTKTRHCFDIDYSRINVPLPTVSRVPRTRSRFKALILNSTFKRQVSSEKIDSRQAAVGCSRRFAHQRWHVQRMGNCFHTHFTFVFCLTSTTVDDFIELGTINTVQLFHWMGPPEPACGPAHTSLHPILSIVSVVDDW